jgi:hypothetical protein
MHVLTPDEVLFRGLAVFKFTVQRQNKCSRATNLDRFANYFGRSPTALGCLWVDLQTTQNPNAKVVGSDKMFYHFMMAIHHLRKYPTEEDHEGNFGCCPNTARKYIRIFMKRIQAMKDEKIVWSDDLKKKMIFFSVDGIDCRLWEDHQSHATLTVDPDFCSHKSKSAAFRYEVALAIWKNQIIHVRGPFKAGKWNDGKIFSEDGVDYNGTFTHCLKSIVPDGNKGVADGGYTGHGEQLTTPNRYDPEPLRKFKRRAKARQETLNSRLKSFRILDSRFRHGLKWHKVAFEAVCVVVQYEMENGHPLFDV